MSELLIWLFSLLAMSSAILLVFTKSILYGAYSLVISLLSLAALYVLLQAEFVGITQLMIYVGGIIILLLFAIMLTHKLKGKTLLTAHYNRFAGIILFFISVGSFTWMAMLWSDTTLSAREPVEIMRETGIYLMTTYLLPMEFVAILLLLVLIGAITIAGQRFRKEPRR